MPSGGQNDQDLGGQYDKQTDDDGDVLGDDNEDDGSNHNGGMHL